MVLASYYSIRVMRLIDCKCIREIDLTNRLLRVRVTDKHIVWTSLDNTIRITRIKDGKLVYAITYTIENTPLKIESICLSPDGKYIAMGGYDVFYVNFNYILLNPMYAQNVNMCRQWTRILLRDQMPKPAKKHLTQLLVYFQTYSGLVPYVGTKLML